MADANKTTARQQFLDSYTALVNGISTARFDEFKDFFTNENDFEVAVQEFRDGLQQELLAKVNRLWNECDIDTNVEILESLKSKAAGSSNKMWRPTGKSVSEQVRPLVVNKLKTSLKFYQLQLGFQKERTEITNEQKTFDSIRAHHKELEQKVNVDLLNGPNRK
uniref:Uncharacterized protein n=1 Tax=Anopheles quadriannulatus TaxID=34691 RepID=A0A182XJE3_ANOQN